MNDHILIYGSSFRVSSHVGILFYRSLICGGGRAERHVKLLPNPASQRLKKKIETVKRPR